MCWKDGVLGLGGVGSWLKRQRHEIKNRTPWIVYYSEFVLVGGGGIEVRCIVRIWLFEPS